MEAVTTSIRMPAEVRDHYETLAQALGRTRNELMVDALRQVAIRRLRELAMIQEGIDDMRAGRVIPLEDLVAQFRRDGMLSPSFVLDEDGATA